MPKKDTDDLANRYWLVGIAGGSDEEMLIHAAYVVYHDVFETPTVHAVGSGPRVAMATLKDENHKVVFQMPMAALKYVRRADVTALADRSWTPGQVAEAKAELREAATASE